MPGNAITMISSRLKDERGVALVIALVALLIGLLLATTVVMAATGESFLSSRDTAQKRSFEAAQAGLQRTLYDMNTLLNTDQESQNVVETECIAGTTAGVNANEMVTGPTLNLVPSTNGNIDIDCAPDTQSLGNGAFYESWTSIVLGLVGSNPPPCAGPIVGASELVTNRCIVSEGIVCPPSYSAPTCPNPVISRVEERVAAATGKPLFPLQGVLAPNGSLIKNTGKIYGTLSTNAEVSLANGAQVTRSIVEASQPADIYKPLISNSALLCNNLNANPITNEDCNSADAGTVCNASTNTWPSACVTPFIDPTTGGPGKISLAEDAIPPASSTDDKRIVCAEINMTCAHDNFLTSSGPCYVNANGCATWDATTRALTIPNGVTWQIGGASGTYITGTYNYNFCSFTMSGGNSGTQTLLADGVRAEIYIDSWKNDGPPATATTCPGTFTVGQGAAFVNQSHPLPNSPLPVDTTALFIDIYGQISPIPDSGTNPQPASYNYNSCNLNGNTTDSSCVQLGQSSNFYGVVYAPESDVKIANTGATYGGIAGRTVTFDNPGSFTQDVNVTRLITTAVQALYFRSAWVQCYAQPTSSSNPMSGC